jgi:type VI secretion system protein ImpM
MQPDVTVGFYGKLPSLGDFVGRRAPNALLETWDGWLQSAVAASREAIGAEWLDLYLTAPMWRFFAQAGVLDAAPVAGVMFPSVDRVGRCFPFTVFAQLPTNAVGLVVTERCSDWFERVEDLLLAQLEDSNLDLDGLDQALLALTPRLQGGLANGARAVAATTHFPRDFASVSNLLHLPLGDRPDVAPVALAWLDGFLRSQAPRSIYWWSSGSAQVKPSWLVTAGLPEPAAFGSMLRGAWHEWPWNSCETATAGAPVAGRTDLHLESAGTTHPGKVRSENQDAWLSRPDAGLWAVADGMGGHSHGSLASQLARDSLGNVAPRPALAQMVQSVRAALEEANNYLFAMSLRPKNPVTSGTTIVVLLVQDQTGVCLWAGDSRLYRLRDGTLEQLTVDHSEDEESADGNGGGFSNVITRAVGGRDGLDLDQVSFHVQLGDRFLLCSDGLYRETSDQEIAQFLRSGDSLTAVDAMLAHVLRGKAADNVTAIVVDAQPGAN